MNNAILLASIIASLGILYDSFEFISSREEVLQKFYQWRVVRSRYYILINRPALSLIFDFIFSPRIFMTLVVTHGLAAVVFPLLFLYNMSLAAIPAAFILIVHCITNVRLLVGRDGADQMQNIIWGGILVYCLPLNETVKIVAVAFIAGQLILSYLVSGIAKLISPVWRNGTAINLVTRMATYCPPGISRVFRNRILSFIVSWFIILFEVFSPLLLLFGAPGAIIFIVLGILFHLGIAFSMGLITFVFAFLAAYPIMYEIAARF